MAYVYAQSYIPMCCGTPIPLATSSKTCIDVWDERYRLSLKGFELWIIQTQSLYWLPYHDVRNTSKQTEGRNSLNSNSCPLEWKGVYVRYWQLNRTIQWLRYIDCIHCFPKHLRLLKERLILKIHGGEYRETVILKYGLTGLLSTQFRSVHTVAKIDLRRVRLSGRLRAFRSTRNSAVPIGWIEDFCGNMRSAIFWDFTQRVVAIPYRHFGPTCRSQLQGPRNPKREICWETASTVDTAQQYRVIFIKTQVRCIVASDTHSRSNFLCATFNTFILLPVICNSTILAECIVAFPRQQVIRTSHIVRLHAHCAGLLSVREWMCFCAQDNSFSEQSREALIALPTILHC